MFVNPTKFNSPYHKEMLEGLKSAGQSVIVVARGNSIAGWEVLHPPSGDRLPKADDNATVLAREVHGVRVLLLSDLGEAGQADLTGSGLDLRSDIVVSAMPGVAKRGVPVFNTLSDGGIEIEIRRTGEWRINSMHGREVLNSGEDAKN